MRRLRLNSVRSAIQTQLWQGVGSDILTYLFRHGVNVTVFAGAVRDVVLAQECGWAHVKPRDWDIGLSGISQKEFDGIFRELGGVKNKYGGFKLFANQPQYWEIWRQEDTVGLRKTGAAFSLENLLRSFVLSCNAIAFNLDTGYLHDCGAMRSLCCGYVTLLEDAIMHDSAVFAAKALNLTFRRPLKISIELEQFLTRHLEMTSLIHEFAKIADVKMLTPQARTQR